MSRTYSDEYFKGYMVGVLTILTLLVPVIIVISIIDWLPPLPREIGLIAFAFGLLISLFRFRLVDRIEKHYRLWFEKENVFTSNNQTGNKGEKQK